MIHLLIESCLEGNGIDWDCIVSSRSSLCPVVSGWSPSWWILQWSAYASSVVNLCFFSGLSTVSVFSLPFNSQSAPL